MWFATARVLVPEMKNVVSATRTSSCGEWWTGFWSWVHFVSHKVGIGWEECQSKCLAGLQQQGHMHNPIQIHVVPKSVGNNHELWIGIASLSAELVFFLLASGKWRCIDLFLIGRLRKFPGMNTRSGGRLVWHLNRWIPLTQSQIAPWHQLFATSRYGCVRMTLLVGTHEHTHFIQLLPKAIATFKSDYLTPQCSDSWLWIISIPGWTRTSICWILGWYCYWAISGIWQGFQGGGQPDTVCWHWESKLGFLCDSLLHCLLWYEYRSQT